MSFPKMALVLNCILVLLVGISQGSAQSSLGQLRSPCINTAVAGNVPDAFNGGVNLFSGMESADVLIATEPTEPVIVRLVMEGLGIFRDIALVEFDFKNACAAIDTSNNQRIIYFDRSWLDEYSKDDFWIKVGIFAHEIGHHVNNHTYESDSVARIRREHEADVFAGAAIAALGGSLTDALAFAGKQPIHWTNTHPGRATRLSSIKEGYERVAHVKSRVVHFADQVSKNDTTRPTSAESAVQISKNEAFSRALTAGLLNTLRPSNDPVFSVEGVHETHEADGETIPLDSLPRMFVPASATDKDTFLGNIYGGVSSKLIELAVAKYTEEFSQVFWDRGPETGTLIKPSIAIKSAITFEDFIVTNQHCGKPEEFTRFIENYFILMNFYASFYERAVGSDSYFTDTGDDYTKFKTDGYIEDPVSASKMSLDNALAAGFASVLERTIASFFSKADTKWTQELRTFLVDFLEYRNLNVDVISSAKRDPSNNAWSSDYDGLVSPFKCTSELPRLYADIRTYGSQEDNLHSTLGSESWSLGGEVETRILGFWVRRHLNGTDEILANSISSLIAKL